VILSRGGSVIHWPNLLDQQSGLLSGTLVIRGMTIEPFTGESKIGIVVLIASCSSEGRLCGSGGGLQSSLLNSNLTPGKEPSLSGTRLETSSHSGFVKTL
jgi:hypothetical protein